MDIFSECTVVVRERENTAIWVESLKDVTCIREKLKYVHYQREEKNLNINYPYVIFDSGIQTFKMFPQEY